MHTDEYEISLTRELRVCEKTAEKIRKKLAVLEAKYKMKTEVFIETHERCALASQNDDFAEWSIQYEALRKWETLATQYAKLLREMKI